MRPRPAAAAVALLLALVLIAGRRSATAAPIPQVVLVRPQAAPPSVAEALVRLRGELVAAGFEAEVLELPLGADVRESLERLSPPAANAHSTTALVAVVASADPGSAELWVIDRVTGKTVVRRVNAASPDPSRAAEVLAVRAVELLRASFLELAIAPPSEAAAAPLPTAPVVERWATAPLEERDWIWAIEAGGATGISVQGPWNQFMAVARLERAFGRWFCGRLTFTGLGPPGHVATDTGSADISETWLLAEAVVRFRRDRRLQPQISAGGGALLLNVDGQEVTPNTALASAHWSAAGDVGAGLRVPLRRHRFEIGLEAHALFAQPYPKLLFFGQEIGLVGRPTVLVTLTLLGGV
ncbi:MAG TPA: hypothetical protein VMT03_25490 [Polyangia bacterium]|nr:hypothetical protein [Polyangia bacterium]